MMDVRSMYGNHHHHHSNNFHNTSNDVNATRNVYTNAYFPVNHAQQAQTAYAPHVHALSYGSYNGATAQYYPQQQQTQTQQQQQQAQQQQEQPQTKQLTTPPLVEQQQQPQQGQQQTVYSHSHLFSPSAAEYGIVTSSNTNGATTANTPHSSNSPVESYYESDSMHSYYASAPTSTDSPLAAQTAAPSVVPTIISSENGLSYTNLDSLYNQNPTQSQQHMQQSYEYGTLPMSCINSEEKYSNVLNGNFGTGGILLDENSLPIESQKQTATNAAWHHHHTNHPHLPVNYTHQETNVNLDSTMTLHNHVHNNMSNMHQNTQLPSQLCEDINSATNCGSLRNQQPISPSSNNSQPNSSSSQTQSKSPNNTSNLPTYKWMQLKRNVPKPQRKYRIILSINRVPMSLSYN